MDRRTLLAIALCFLIFMGWQKLYLEPRMPRAPQAPTTATQTQGRPSSPSGTSQKQGQSITAPTAVAQKPLESKPVATAIGTAQVGNGSKFFTGWDLKTYRLGIAPEAAAVDLRSVTHQEGGVELAFDLPEYSYLNTVQGNLTSNAQGVVWNYEDANVKITREFISAVDRNYVDGRVTAEFKGKKPNFAFLIVGSQSSGKEVDEADRQLLYWTNQSVERMHLKDVELREVKTPVKWVGASNRYFLLTVITQGDLQPNGLIQPAGEHSGRVSLVYPVAGNSITVPFRAYFGPKELNTLRSVEPTLDHTVDFGWFTVFAYPLLRLMKWLYQFVHNYGVAIILLTLLLKVATYPLTYKSMKSMKEMARLQPQLQRLKEKHKDDREALNREMLTLMRTHGYNPMAGCLPILIQMPVFFALYRVLYGSIELYQAPFAVWIQDLAARDPYYVTPILLSLTMYVQQKLTPNTATDPMQAKMLQFMPLIFGAFMLTLPSGLTLYMLTNAVASIVQQMILNKKLGIHGANPTPAKAR